MQFEKLESKKLLFILDKSESFDLFINSFPYDLDSNFKFDFSSVFESNHDFHVILVIDITSEFLDH